MTSHSHGCQCPEILLGCQSTDNSRQASHRSEFKAFRIHSKAGGLGESLETWYLSSPRPGATLDISEIRQALQPGALRPGSGPSRYYGSVPTSLSPKALKGVATIDAPFPKVGKLSPREGQQMIHSNRQPGHRSPCQV